MWGLSAQIAKKELEALASGHTGAEDEVKLKVNQTVSQELEEKAIKGGMQPPLSDQERPSLYTLSKVKHNFAQVDHMSTCPGRLLLMRTLRDG